MGFVLTVVIRYLFSSRGDRLFGLVTIFSVIAIAIGVAAINTVQAGQNGIIAQTLYEARRGVPDVILRGTLEADPSIILAKIRAWPEVAKADVFVEGQAAVSFKGRTQPVLLRGLETNVLVDLLRSQQTDEYSPVMLNTDNLPQWFTVLPETVGQRLGVFDSEAVELLSADGQNTALGWTPRSKSFEVVGFHDFGGSLPIAYVPLPKAQIYLRKKGEWSGILVDLEDKALSKNMRTSLENMLSDAGIDVSLETWEDFNVIQADVFRVMKRVMSIVLALIMIIAGFNIFASQLMLVREKRMSIAVFRTMGSTRKELIFIFVLIGQAIGIGGVVAGMLLTVLFGWAAELFSIAIPLHYVAADLVGIAAIAVVVCFIATLYPAIRASSVEPAIVLREA